MIRVDPTLPAYRVDAARWPLVVMTPTANVRDPNALDPMYAALEELLARRDRFTFIFDMRGGASDAQRRKRWIDWVERNRSAITRYAVATAAVVGNGLERGFITAALWLVTTPCPVRIFTNQPAAEAWLKQMYEGRTPQQASVPPR